MTELFMPCALEISLKACSWCDKTVVIDDKVNKPLHSKYHLQDMSEVYCDAKCSLLVHENKD